MSVDISSDEWMDNFWKERDKHCKEVIYTLEQIIPFAKRFEELTGAKISIDTSHLQEA